MAETSGERKGINQNPHTNFENLWDLNADVSSPFNGTRIAHIAWMRISRRLGRLLGHVYNSENLLL